VSAPYDVHVPQTSSERTLISRDGCLSLFGEGPATESPMVPILEALMAGETRPADPGADCQGSRTRTKIDPLSRGLIGRFSEHHEFTCRLYLDRLDAQDEDIAKLPDPDRAGPWSPVVTPSPGSKPSQVSDAGSASLT
jgi:hypothetical protein